MQAKSKNNSVNSVIPAKDIARKLLDTKRFLLSKKDIKKKDLDDKGIKLAMPL